MNEETDLVPRSYSTVRSPESDSSPGGLTAFQRRGSCLPPMLRYCRFVLARDAKWDTDALITFM